MFEASRAIATLLEELVHEEETKDIMLGFLANKDMENITIDAKIKWGADGMGAVTAKATKETTVDPNKLFLINVGLFGLYGKQQDGDVVLYEKEAFGSTQEIHQLCVARIDEKEVTKLTYLMKLANAELDELEGSTITLLTLPNNKLCDSY